jgi:hypothetical protein
MFQFKSKWRSCIGVGDWVNSSIGMYTMVEDGDAMPEEVGPDGQVLHPQVLFYERQAAEKAAMRRRVLDVHRRYELKLLPPPPPRQPPPPSPSPPISLSPSLPPPPSPPSPSQCFKAAQRERQAVAGADPAVEPLRSSSQTDRGPTDLEPDGREAHRRRLRLDGNPLHESGGRTAIATTHCEQCGGAWRQQRRGKNSRVGPLNPTRIP